MKRVIKCGDDMRKTQVDDDYCAQIYERNPALFDKYVQRISSRNISEKRRSCKGGFVIQFNSLFHNAISTHYDYCPITPEDILKMGDQIIEVINRRANERAESATLTQDLKRKGLKRMTANSYTRAVIEEELGLTVFKPLCPKYGSAFHLSHMPFTDSRTTTLDVSEGEKFREKFMNILDRLSSDYGFEYYGVSTPLSGVSRVRGCWKYSVDGPDVAVKRNSLEVVEILSN